MPSHHIIITYTIASGSMGEGWRSQEETAQAFATYLKPRLLVEAFFEVGADPIIDTDVRVIRASGSLTGVEVCHNGAEELDCIALQDTLNDYVQREWVRFCATEAAKDLWDEEGGE